MNKTFKRNYACTSLRYHIIYKRLISIFFFLYFIYKPTSICQMYLFAGEKKKKLLTYHVTIGLLKQLVLLNIGAPVWGARLKNAWVMHLQ